jgi:hypothetical protein
MTEAAFDGLGLKLLNIRRDESIFGLYTISRGHNIVIEREEACTTVKLKTLDH